MNVNRLEAVLYDLGTSRKSAERFNESADEFLARYRLTADETEAVKNAEVGVMRSCGVNPMLTMGFWLVVRGRREMGEYMKRMKGAEGKADG